MASEEILQYLCCPKCKSNLMEQGDFLICERCNAKYETQSGIPILADFKNLPIHLQKQVKYFIKEDGGRPEYKLDEWQKSYIRRFEENFSPQRGELLIDVGTGSGYMAIEMAKRGLKVIACDLTLKELIKLKEVIKKEHLENNLFLVCCSAEDLPFKTGITDYLVSTAVLEHLPREEGAIADIARVCKDISGLLVTVPIKFKYVLPILWLPTYFHDKNIGHLRKYDKNILKNLFAGGGFKIKKVYYSGHIEKAIVTSLGKLGIKSKKWDEWAETRDRQKENKKYFCCNICVVFIK